MAPKKTNTEHTTVTPGVDIPDYVADNYRGLVADESRNLTYADVADRAEAEGDATLAAWARREAEQSGKNITPTGATTDPDKAKRDADAAAKAAGDETHARTGEETGQTDATDAGGTPPTGVPVDYNTKTIDELKEILEPRGVDFSGFSLKAEYVDAAEKSDQAATK